MRTRRVSRVWLAGRVLLLAVGVALASALPALADYLGPNRTTTTWEWRRLHCHYEAVYDPPGAGWYGCTLDLYDTPDSSCPSSGSVEGYFDAASCGWSISYCQIFGCNISRSGSVEGCSDGDDGCRAVEQQTTQPEASVSGSIGCTAPGSNGWCRGGAELALAGSEPLAGYTILALEGTRNGGTFACAGAACSVTLLEGPNDFSFWAVSSWGDTSRMGSAGGGVDTQPPMISGFVTGSAGDSGWYVSDVTVDVTASDPAPGSGVAGVEVALDGGGWTPYAGPIPLSEGSHTLDMRAADAAGNATVEAQAIGVDTLPPVLSLSAGASFCPGCGERLDVGVDIQDAGSGVMEWALSVGAATVAGGSAAASETISWDGGGLSGGPHTLILGVRDAAGNTSESSLPVTLIDPTPEPPDEEDAPPRVGPIRPSATPPTTPSAIPTATRPSRPTPTAEVIQSGGVPAAPLEDVGEAAGPTPPIEALGGPRAPVRGSSSGVLWGAAALALIGSATALALDQARRRREAEARQREEMERRNAEAEVREQAELAALAAAKEEAEFQLTAGQIMQQATGGEQPSQEWLMAAAAAVETARSAWERRIQKVEKAEPTPDPAALAVIGGAAFDAARRTLGQSRADEPTPTPAAPPTPPTPGAVRTSTPSPTATSPPPTSTPTPVSTFSQPHASTFTIREIQDVLQLLPSVRGPLEPIRHPAGSAALPFGMIEVGRVLSIQPVLRANPGMWAGADSSIGAAAGSPSTGVSVSPRGWRAGFRFPGPSVPVNVGESLEVMAETGSSLYIGFEPGGFFQSTVTVDVNLVDFRAHLGGTQANGQSGVYMSFKPGMLLLAAVAIGVVVANPLPDELAIPSLLEGGRRLFEGLGR